MPKISVTVSNSDTLTDAATHDVGIAVKSELAVANELASGQPVEVLPNILKSNEAPISTLRLSNLKDSRKADAFIDFTSQCFHTAKSQV